MVKDYYRILGVDVDATPDQIRSAYRKKAKELHPDHYGEDSAPFRILQEAYEVLSDPARRQTHDDALAQERIRQVTPVGRRVEPLIPRASPFARSAVLSFAEILGRLWGRRDEPPPGGEMHVEVHLTQGQALRGGHIYLEVPVQVTCPVCLGYGSLEVYGCAHCAGDGWVVQERPLRVSFPARLTDGDEARAPLDRAGLPGACLVLHFRVRRG